MLEDKDHCLNCGELLQEGQFGVCSEECHEELTQWTEEHDPRSDSGEPISQPQHRCEHCQDLGLFREDAGVATIWAHCYDANGVRLSGPHGLCLDCYRSRAKGVADDGCYFDKTPVEG